MIYRLALAILATWLVMLITACGGAHLISTLRNQRSIRPLRNDVCN